ncbi:MAG TPA: DUF2298 domain-containing protein [Anaerolineaceae bacterium]|nr:DUF2298 domain-containing protein [Anaerolineaceae bacterium]
MTEFLRWYALAVVIAWLNLPLTFRMFKALPGRGFALSRPIGLLLWGYIFWLLTSLKLLNNDLAGQLTALIFLAALNILLSGRGTLKALAAWVREKRKFIISVELLFLAGFALWAFVRAANPAIIGTEKPMEMAFINAILRSPGFPPNDPWLSGYAISYYYFGYVLAAMLIRVTGTLAGVGYNLVAAMWFALTACAAYGLLFDLLSLHAKDAEKDTSWILAASLLAPALLLIVSNWHGFLDVLHARGLFFSSSADGNLGSGFWDWLKLKEISGVKPDYSWFPLRWGGVQWWGASRVLQDFQLNGNALEVIDEFPYFSYLLSDIHPHVLGMPFVLAAVSQALNAFFGGWEGRTRVWRWEIPWSFPEILLAVLTLGGIAFLNTWDFPFYLALIAAALVYRRWLSHGWSGRRIGEFLLVCVGLAIPAVLAYFPFYASFSSQAGGILPSLAFFTAGKYFWIMFGPLLVPLLCGLTWLLLKNKARRSVGTAFWITAAFFAGLFAFSWLISFIALRLPELGQLFLALQGAAPGQNPLTAALVARLKAPGTGITLFGLFFLCLTALIQPKNGRSLEPKSPMGQTLTPAGSADIFVILLVVLGSLLTLAPEFVYLRDQFGTRMNTIFKFYFQAWILWSAAGAYFTARLLEDREPTRPHRKIFPALMLALGAAAAILGLYRADEVFARFNQNLGAVGSAPLDYVILGIFLVGILWLLTEFISRRPAAALAVLCICGFAAGLVYPVVSTWNKLGGTASLERLTLDGTSYYREYWPEQMQAVDWLKQQPLGVMVEAVSDTGGSYTTYASVSTFSGMPTVLGWIGHVAQWRGGYTEMGSRQDDIRKLYSTKDWEEARAILNKYNIAYVYIGELEARTYALEESKFAENLKLGFDSPNARVYIYSPEK